MTAAGGRESGWARLMARYDRLRNGDGGYGDLDRDLDDGSSSDGSSDGSSNGRRRLSGTIFFRLLSVSALETQFGALLRKLQAFFQIWCLF